jgi:hypothetical protein
VEITLFYCEDMRQCASGGLVLFPVGKTLFIFSVKLERAQGSYGQQIPRLYNATADQQATPYLPFKQSNY